jgi:hypothetical protein
MRLNFLRGVAAAALVSMFFAAMPLVEATVLTNSWGERELTKIVVLMGVAIALGASLIIGFAFLPSYLLARRRLWHTPVPHMIWGTVVVGTVLFFLYNPRHQSFTPRDIMIAVIWVVGGGVAEGYAFWKGAFPEGRGKQDAH